MITTDNIFIHGSIDDNPNLRKFETECMYSSFSENQRVFMALRKSIIKI